METEGEWDSAGFYQLRGGAQARAQDVLTGMYYGYDPDQTYLRVDAKQAWADLGEGVLGIYLGLSGAKKTVAFTRLDGSSDPLGFGATALVEVAFAQGRVSGVTLSVPGSFGSWTPPDSLPDLLAAAQGRILEVGIPFELLGAPKPGDKINLKAIWTAGDPQAGREVQRLPRLPPDRAGPRRRRGDAGP